MTGDEVWDIWVKEKIKPSPVDDSRPLIFYSEEQTRAYKKQKRREKAKENRKSSKKASDGQKAGQKRKLGTKKVEPTTKKPRNYDHSERDQLKVTFNRSNEKPRKVISSKIAKSKKSTRGGKNDSRKSSKKEDFQQRTQGSQRKAPKSPERIANPYSKPGGHCH